MRIVLFLYGFCRFRPFLLVALSFQRLLQETRYLAHSHRLATSMSGSVLRDACSKGDLWNIERILGGAQDFSLMRSPIYTGVQSEGWVRRKAVYDIINSRDNLGKSIPKAPLNPAA